MLKKLVARAAESKIGTSKVVDHISDVYDYIIVGAGAGGNVLANRLTEDGTTSVLLLEAGGDDVKNPGVHMTVSPAQLQESSFDWQYKTVPQQRAGRSLKNRQMSYPSGRGLGGSGSINFMAYLRGSRYDYDEWAEMGCKGWSYRDILPYFIKAEDNANEEYVKSGYHGKAGPMKVSDLSRTPLVEAFLEAGKELGYGIIDINGRSQIGFSNAQANMHEGMRWSTAHGYLRPAMERDNLDVAIQAQVSKVMFEQKSATGVEICQHEQTVQVKARKEVIISAGAIETPRILMLSGIGPRKHLEKFKLPVLADLPVGDNLQDHPMCVLDYTIDRPFSVNVDSTMEDQSSSAKDYQQYMFYTSGYTGVPDAQGGVAYIRTRYAPRDRFYPDIQLQLASTLGADILRKTWNLKDEVWQALYEGSENKQGFLLMSSLLHPKSTGTVRLRSTDPHDKPNIDPNYLAHPDDARTLVEGMRVKLQLGNTSSFQALGAAPSKRVLPSGRQFTLYSDSYLENYVRHHTLTGHNATGTCKMGPNGDFSAVVDPELRVLGVKNLRVVDASVMPRVPSGATSNPTIMIAEKAADMIRGIDSVKDIHLPEDVFSVESEPLKQAV